MTRLGWLALVAGLIPAMAGAQPAPPPLTAPVNDFAGVIDPASAAELDRLTRVLQAATGDVVVVATVTTAAEWGDIRAYATEMFENHGKGIGQQGRDNGLLVLVAVEDRQVWLEVGYDLEGFIPDGFAGETSRHYMTPEFREGRYGAGLVAGVTRVVQRIAEGRQVTLDGVAAPVRPERQGSRGAPPIGALIFAAILVMNLLGGLGGRRGRRRGW
ncbi:MAG: TPM domain-containing protein, partial [Vicinamibacterales bacterium]|nr:TPM domain-containing protein [Vicinamibacterales bacterium]